MILNESKGNMYEFITHTWNPIKGRCFHDCAYCYMKSLVQNPQPIRLVESELKGIFQRDQFIFIGSSTDDFASDVPSEWLNKILDFCVQATSHQTEGNKTQFLIQTKNPERILEFINHPLFQTQRVVVCTTIETNRHYPEIMNNAPTPIKRAEAMAKIAECGIRTFVTIEPIMDFDLDEMVKLIKMCKPEQVNIGKNTSTQIQLPEPTRFAVANLIFHLICSTKIKIKKNIDGEKLTKAIITIFEHNYSYEKDKSKNGNLSNTFFDIYLREQK